MSAPHSNSDTGSTYVFKNINDNWTEMAKLTASDGTINDMLGLPASISGDYIIIGTFGGKNQAYLFERTNENWGEIEIFRPIGNNYQRYGQNVDISGDYIIISDWYDDTYGFDKGLIYIYQNNGIQWEFTTTIMPHDAPFNDNYYGCGSFLRGVSIYDTGLFAYASFGCLASTTDINVIYIFSNEYGFWHQIHEFALPSTFANTFVSLSLYGMVITQSQKGNSICY